jgi:AraC-like DNA-binding protein
MEPSTVRPRFMADHPTGQSPGSDVLSDVLRAVRLTGAVFFAVEGTSPWALEGPTAVAIGPFIRPGVEHILQFHAVASGSCWGGLVGEPPVRLHAGDVILLPQDARHRLSSAPGLVGAQVPVRLDPSARVPLPLPVRLGEGDQERCQVICGFLGSDARPFNPLLSALPSRMLVARAAQPGAALAKFIELALAESSALSAGRESMLARLAELMFVETVRRYVAETPEQAGWLAGVSDPLVGQALSLLHSRARDPWTLETLARSTATSRSVLAERFHALVGIPPMQYLGQWRMQLTAELLAGTRASLAEIADRVGYGSEAALSRAFKRIVGTSPARWREGKTGGRRPSAAPGAGGSSGKEEGGAR